MANAILAFVLKVGLRDLDVLAGLLFEIAEGVLVLLGVFGGGLMTVSMTVTGIAVLLLVLAELDEVTLAIFVRAQ